MDSLEHCRDTRDTRTPINPQPEPLSSSARSPTSLSNHLTSEDKPEENNSSLDNDATPRPVSPAHSTTPDDPPDDPHDDPPVVSSILKEIITCIDSFDRPFWKEYHLDASYVDLPYQRLEEFADREWKKFR
ncbi:hypothetical protein A1O3_04717 [Capronia epimyces CBS 606.96]|uniref:Uncharacterized protein n=1 Tax=Capronia epimyces CBS 606.96 TaxID=1182542 RepID=W9Y332_9EURO|nr:uncharacterized protein A1O3_04717 [Capronia epimyces CBS 606.96]EXJ84050.1 hypothetical protein A1O3_04717 [Capronia epimyces CBS 606.96]